MSNLVDADGAARLLAVSTKTVRRLAQRGELPYTRIGRLVRFDPRDIQRYAERNRVDLRRGAEVVAGGRS